MGQRNPTKITETLEVDDPLIQNAGFAFDKDDRQFLDNQTRGAQKHLVDALIRGRHATYLRVASSSGALVAGDCVCLASLDEGEPKVTKALLGALGDAIAVFGVVVVAAAPGSFALIAFGGVLPPTITGLAKNAKGFVRVNTTTGRCERVVAFDTGDYGIGVVDKAGYMLVIPGIGAANTVMPAGAIPGGPVRSVQFHDDDHTFGGAAEMAISQYGYPRLGVSSGFGSGAASDDAMLNVCRAFTMRCRANPSNPNNTVMPFRHTINTANCRDAFWYGDQQDGTFIPAQRFIQILAAAAGGIWNAGVCLLGPDAVQAGTTATGVHVSKNLALGPRLTTYSGDPFWRGADHMLNLAAQVTPPSSAPTASIDVRCHPTLYKPQWLRPGDNPSTGWRDFGGDSELYGVSVDGTVVAGVLDLAALDTANGLVATVRVQNAGGGPGGIVELTNVTGLDAIPGRRVAIKFPSGGRVPAFNQSAEDVFTRRTRYFAPGEWGVLVSEDLGYADVGEPPKVWGVIGGRDDVDMPEGGGFVINMANANKDYDPEGGTPSEDELAILRADVLVIYSSTPLTGNKTLQLPGVYEGGTSSPGPMAVKTWDVIANFTGDFYITISNGAGAPNVVRLGPNDAGLDGTKKRAVRIISTPNGIFCSGFSSREIDAAKNVDPNPS